MFNTFAAAPASERKMPEQGVDKEMPAYFL